MSASNAAPTPHALVTYEQFLEMAKAEPQGWFWERMIPASGVVMLAGDPFVGKTTLLAALVAAASSENDSFVGGLYVEESRVLYCHLEHRLSHMSELLERARLALGLGRNNVDFFLRLNLDNEEEIENMDKAAEVVGANVIVIDSIRRATASAENSADDISQLAHRLYPLTKQNQRLVLFVHHLSKAGDPRGTTDWRAQVDSWLKMIPGRNAGSVTVVASHHSSEPHTANLRFVNEPGRLVVEAAGQHPIPAVSIGVNQAIVSAILAHCGDPRTTNELRAHVSKTLGGVEHKVVDATRDWMSQQGLIQNLGVTKHKHQWVKVHGQTNPAGGSLSTGSPP